MLQGQGDVYILKQGLEVEYFSTDQEQIEKVWFNMHGRLLNHLMEAYNLTDDVIISHCDVEHEIFKNTRCPPKFLTCTRRYVQVGFYIFMS